MLSKNEIKDIQSLSEKKFRNELKLFPAEGPKIAAEFLQLIPSQVKSIFATKEWMETNPDVRNVKEVTEKELERISHLKTPNQVLLLMEFFQNSEPVNVNFAIYCDTIQDPGNLGTIIRIADWYNIKNIICSNGCADIYNPKLVQSTMGSLARVNVYYDEKENWLQKQNLPVIAATLNGTSVYNHPKTEKGILLVGNESKGLRKELIELATEQVTIPKIGNAESLNAAVATAIIVSHLLS